MLDVLSRRQGTNSREAGDWLKISAHNISDRLDQFRLRPDSIVICSCEETSKKSCKHHIMLLFGGCFINILMDLHDRMFK